MDLYIRITDENGDELQLINVCQDGSDSMGALTIVDYILDNFKVEPQHDYIHIEKLAARVLDSMDPKDILAAFKEVIEERYRENKTLFEEDWDIHSV